MPAACLRSERRPRTVWPLPDHRGVGLCRQARRIWVTPSDGGRGCGYDGQMYSWTRSPCAVQLQVDAEDGWVSVVHSPSSARTILRADSRNLFGVRWEGGLYPTPSGACGAFGGCEARGASSCLCDVSVNTSAPFVSASDLPTAAEILERLHLGSAPPGEKPSMTLLIAPCLRLIAPGCRPGCASSEDFDAGEYAMCATAACQAAAADGVTAYLHALGPADALDARTIFRVDFVNGSSTPLYRINKASTVHVANSTYAFRNAVRFVDFVEPAARDAAHETDALLDHLVTHKNTAPFLAYRLIQRLVTSNPSPRYVRVVAEAFVSGSHGGVTYSAKHADLAATTAAILLDREVRALPPTAIDCHRLPSIAIGCHRLPSTAIDCHRLPSIAIDCHRLPPTATDCHRLPPTRIHRRAPPH